MKVALLESDRSRSLIISRALSADGHRCEVILNGSRLRDMLHAERFDLLVLGKGRGGPDAVEIIRLARAELQPELPILLLVANGDQETIARALASGANDYLCLPVRAAELKTRIGVLLSRAYPERVSGEMVQFGQFRFDTFAHRLMRSGEPVQLTRREFDLAIFLFRHLGQPLSRTTIGEAVWESGSDIPSRTIDTHISRVRTKLKLRPEHGYRLMQVYGYGYRLESADDHG